MGLFARQSNFLKDVVIGYEGEYISVLESDRREQCFEDSEMLRKRWTRMKSLMVTTLATMPDM